MSPIFLRDEKYNLFRLIQISGNESCVMRAIQTSMEKKWVEISDIDLLRMLLFDGPDFREFLEREEGVQNYCVKHFGFGPISRNRAVCLDNLLRLYSDPMFPGDQLTVEYIANYLGVSIAIYTPSAEQWPGRIQTVSILPPSTIPNVHILWDPTTGHCDALIPEINRDNHDNADDDDDNSSNTSDNSKNPADDDNDDDDDTIDSIEWKLNQMAREMEIDPELEKIEDDFSKSSLAPSSLT